MPEIDICVNSLENAKRFVGRQDGRKAPNQRVGDVDFWDIAMEGADVLEEDSEN